MRYLISSFALRRVMPALVACFADFAVGAEQWTVTTADFKTSRVALRAIANDQLTGVASNDQTITIPLKSFVQATYPIRIESPSGLVLCLVGGDRLIGQPRRIDGQNMVWFVAGAGEVPVPIERALGILRDRADSPALNESRGEDEARLMNGDIAKGIVAAMTERSITLTPTGGSPVEVPANNIRELYFAAPPQGREPIAPPPFTLRLSGGTVISCQNVALEGEQLKLIFSDQAGASIPVNLVASIEHTGGPVAWLSMRTPSEAVYTPFFDGQFTPQMDRAVTGEPIRLGSQIIHRGIGVHSKTRLTWDIRPGDKTFRTRYAIDPELGYADVDVRVLVDGKIAHEAKGVKAGTVSDMIEADLHGAKKLTLEVDYGQGYDIQDRVNWIEPAIVRE